MPASLEDVGQQPGGSVVRSFLSVAHEDDGTLKTKGSGSGSASVIVAASNAPTNWISDADYQCDGTDDEVQIQAAIASLPAQGGTVQLSPGLFIFGTSTLTVTASGVHIRGVGKAADLFTAASGRGTSIKPAAAWPLNQFLVQIQPVTNGLQLLSSGIGDLTLNCIPVSGTNMANGLELVNVQSAEFPNLEIRNANQNCLLTGAATVSAGAAGVSLCEFRNLTIRAVDAGSANGINLDGSAAGNTFANVFSNVYVEHKDGVGIQLNNCDDNWFFGVSVHRTSGSGISIEFNGSDTGLTDTARYNTLTNVSLDFDSGTFGGITARGTSTFTYPALGNRLINYTVANSNPWPTVEAGATLFYDRNSGYSNVGQAARKASALGYLAISCEEPSVVQASPTTQTVMGAGVYLYAGQIVTNIHVCVQTAGVGADPTAAAVGFWSSAASPVCLAIGPDLVAGGLLKSQGWKTMALSAPYTVLTDGWYYPSFWINGVYGGTNVQLVSMGTMGQAGTPIGSGVRRFGALKSTVATAPAVNDTGTYASSAFCPVMAVS